MASATLAAAPSCCAEIKGVDTCRCSNTKNGARCPNTCTCPRRKPRVPPCCATDQDAAFAPSADNATDQAAAPAAVAKRNGLLSFVLSGMLNSGCCIVQLALSYMPVFSAAGCLGFNTRLKHYRRLFLTITAGWLVFSWARAFGPLRPSGAPRTTRATKCAHPADCLLTPKRLFVAQ